jgi:uncharacterized protein YjbJ (UPF0337 family)
MLSRLDRGIQLLCGNGVYRLVSNMSTVPKTMVGGTITFNNHSGGIVMFNQDIFKGQWHVIKGKLHQTWGELTDDELEQVAGKNEEIYGLLQKHYGYSREKAEEMVDEFIKENRLH